MFNLFGSKRKKIADDLDSLLQEHGFGGSGSFQNYKLFDLKQRGLANLKSLGSSEKILENLVDHITGLLGTDSEFKRMVDSSPQVAQEELTSLIKEIQRVTGGMLKGLPYALAPRILTKARETVRMRGIDPMEKVREQTQKRYELAQRPGTSNPDKMDPETALGPSDMNPDELSMFGLTKADLTYKMPIQRLNKAIEHFMGFERTGRGVTKFKNELTKKMGDETKAEYIFKLLSIVRNMKIMADQFSDVPYEIKDFEMKGLGQTLEETEKLAKNWLKEDEKEVALQPVDIKTTYGYAATALRSLKNLHKYILQDSVQNAMKEVPDLDLDKGVNKLEEFMSKDRNLDMQLFADTIKDIDEYIKKLNLSPLEQKYIYDIFDSHDLIAKTPDVLISEAKNDFANLRRHYMDILRAKDPKVMRKKFNEVMQSYRTWTKSKSAAMTDDEADTQKIQSILNSKLLDIKNRIRALESIKERYDKGELTHLYKKAEDFYNYFHDLRTLYKEQLNLPAIEQLRFMIKEVIKDFRTFMKSAKAKQVWDGHWMSKEKGKNEIKGPELEEKKDEAGNTVKGYFSLLDKGVDSNIVSVMDFLLDSPFIKYLEEKLKSMSQPNMPQVTGPTFAEAPKIMDKLESLGSVMDKLEPNSMFRSLQDKLLKNVNIMEKVRTQSKKTQKEKAIPLPDEPVSEFEKKNTPAAPAAPAAPAPTTTKTAAIKKVAYVSVASYIRKLAHNALTGAEAPTLDLKERHKERQLSKKQPAWERFQKRDRPGGLSTTIPGFFVDPDSVDEFIDALENDSFDFMKSVSESSGALSPELDTSGKNIREQQYDPGLNEIVTKTLLKGSKNLREHILKNDVHMVKDLRRKISRILKEYSELDAQSKENARELEDLNTVQHYRDRLEAMAKFLNAPEQDIQTILEDDNDLLTFYQSQIADMPEGKKKGIRQQVMREEREKKVYDERAILKKKLVKYLEKYIPQKDPQTKEQKRETILKRIQGLQKQLKAYEESGKNYSDMNNEIATLESQVDKMKQDASQKGVGYETIQGYPEAADKLNKMREEVKGYNSVKLGLESANKDLTNLSRPEKEVEDEEYKKAADLLHRSLTNSELLSNIMNEVNLAQVDRVKFERYIKEQEDLITKDKYKKFFDMESWKIENERSKKNLYYTIQQLRNDKKNLKHLKAEAEKLTEENEKEEMVNSINALDTGVENGIENMLRLKSYIAFLDRELKKYEGFMAARAPGIEKEFQRLMETPVFDQPHFSTNPKALQHPIIQNLGLDKITSPDQLNAKMDDIDKVIKMFSDNADKLEWYMKDLDTYRRRLHTAPIPKEKYDEIYPKVMDRYKRSELMMHQLRKNYKEFSKYIEDLSKKLLDARGLKSMEEFLRQRSLPVPVSGMTKQAGTGEPEKEYDNPVDLIKSKPGYEEKIPVEKVMDWDIIDALYERDQDSLNAFKDVFQGGKVDFSDKKSLKQLMRKSNALANRLDQLGKLRNLEVTINNKPIKVSDVGKEFNYLLEEYTGKKNTLIQKQDNIFRRKNDIRFQLNELLKLIGLDADQIMDEAEKDAIAKKESDPEAKIDMTHILESVIQAKDPEMKEFKGFTERELTSIENQYFRDLFWAIMRKWGDKVGENVVFGEKTKPEFSMLYDTFKNISGVKSNPILSKVIRIAQESRRQLKELKKKLASMQQAYKDTKMDLSKNTEYQDTLKRVEHLNKLIAQKKTMNKIIADEVDADFKIKVFEKIKSMTKDASLIEMIDNKIDAYKKQAADIAEDKAKELEVEGKKLEQEVGVVREERPSIPETAPTEKGTAVPEQKLAYDRNHRDFNLKILYGSHMQSKIAEMLSDEIK